METPCKCKEYIIKFGAVEVQNIYNERGNYGNKIH